MDTATARVSPSEAEGPPGVVAKAPRDYVTRKADGWCVYSRACPFRAVGWPDPTHHHCEKHRVMVQKRQAKAKRLQRAELSAAGKCVRCRKPSATYRCPACRIKDQTTLPTVSVHSGIVADPFRPDAMGWKRYRGKGVRGAPPASVDDDQDLTRALDLVTGGREALAYARSPEVTKLGRIQQAGAMRAALARLELAARFLDSIVERRQPKDA